MPSTSEDQNKLFTHPSPDFEDCQCYKCRAFHNPIAKMLRTYEKLKTDHFLKSKVEEIPHAPS